LFFYVKGFSKTTWKEILRLVVPFLLGLSVYLYLPFRASQNPLMNWGNPVDFERFFWHFSAKQYRVWIFTSTDSAAKQMKYFLDTLLPEFAYFPVVLAVLGAWNLFKKNRSVFIFTALLFLGCVLYSINYDIHDIDSYFLLAYFVIAVWCSVGIKSVFEFSKDKLLKWSFGGLIMLGIVVQVWSVYPKIDKSNLFIVEDYSRDMLQSVEPNGVIFSYQWDYFVSASNYLQLVENIRPDVVVIDKELLRRSWYLKQLECRYPWLIAQSKVEVEAFLNELYKFEHDMPYNPRVIEYRYTAMIKGFIEKNVSSRPVYVTQEIEPQYTGDFQRVPSGIAFKLYPDKVFHEITQGSFNFRIPPNKDKYVNGIISLYAQSYYNCANYLSFFSKNDSILPYLNKALEIRPDFKQAEILKYQIVNRK
jgi:hypothetical protein